MRYYIQRLDSWGTVKFSGKVSDFLKLQNLLSEEIIVTRDSELLTDDDVLEDSDTIRLLSVISGG